MPLLQGREGKVTQVYRKKWVIHIERITREKVNGACGWLVLGQSHGGWELRVGWYAQAGPARAWLIGACCVQGDAAVAVLGGGTWGMRVEMTADMGSEQAVESPCDKPSPGITGLTVCLLPCCHLCTPCTTPATGATVNVGIDPSKCIITKLKLDKDRRALLDRKAASKKADKGKGKFTEQEVQAMQQVD